MVQLINAPPGREIHRMSRQYYACLISMIIIKLSRFTLPSSYPRSNHEKEKRKLIMNALAPVKSPHKDMNTKMPRHSQIESNPPCSSVSLSRLNFQFLSLVFSRRFWTMLLGFCSPHWKVAFSSSKWPWSSRGHGGTRGARPKSGTPLTTHPTW